MAKCLVLGANGFIGSHVVDRLVEQGHSIRAFDSFSGNQINFLPNQQIEIITGNFLNRDDLAKALQNMEYVFHFISTTTPMTAENDPLIDIETNVKMSIELFEEAVDKKIKKLIFASTGGAIYGNTGNDQPIGEETMPRPVSPYAIGKLTIEHYLRYFAVKYNLNSLIYRISNPYGERQSSKNRQGVIPIFLHHIAEKEPITILGDGQMVRDYIYIKDVAKMICKSFETASQHLYNIGSGQGVTVNELISAIEQVINQTVNKTHQPNLTTFIEKVVLDVSRFQNEFSLPPEIDLMTGIRKTWEDILRTK